MGVAPQTPSLNMSITINDGFFVLGTKNYTFPIINSDDDHSASSPAGMSPQLSQSPSTQGDPETDALKGMHIVLEKKVKLAPNLAAALNAHTDKESKKQINQNKDKDKKEVTRIFSKSPPVIDLEEAKNECSTYQDTLALNNFSDEILKELCKALIKAIDDWLKKYTEGKTVKIMGCGLSADILQANDFGDRIKTIMWMQYDILPSFFSGNCAPLDQQSETLARKCADLFKHENLPKLTIEESNKVGVDSEHIWYCSLEDYKVSIGEKGDLLMKDLLEAAETINQKQQKITFFSSTAQGGGVALMRHSLIRFMQMLGVDASWYVCTPRPSVFSITKMKVHNVLQNTAQNKNANCPETEDIKTSPNEGNKNEMFAPEQPPSNWMTQEDKDKIDSWLSCNYNSNWKRIVMNSAVVVLDDHQVARLASMIRRDSPNTLIIYRSHIQIRGELINGEKDENGNISAIDNVWNFLWESIQYADYFVSHPFPSAVPKDVPSSKVIFQPAGTDQLDGLNKPLNKSAIDYYQNVFNRICLDNGENPVNFTKKYIVQVARFDPSKGISDLLEAYYKLFCKYKASYPNEVFDVGLVLCGHGSVDDPEATTIFNQVSEKTNEEKFQEIKHLITKVRLPPSDQLLNIILRNAYITCQLSTSEGFEVKVTESLMKEVPVIVYRVGGLPLQVKDGVNGFIIEKGHIEEVAAKLFEMIVDESLYKKIKAGINPKDFIVITTPFQALFWLNMFNRDVEKSKEYYKEFSKKYLS
ncbi:alpha,alpha-trehalose phosphorylase (configuration-retaining) [Nematocida minor]|uniref:alpha,alpha-trehalose phosphorylase (configuration-retaining) n=1 Tax=Nematocida minor TaxID=1912983 RepID=UPI002220690A|nr:alpha,alpha-trehalose phosphorylase (configuration-retaining) [Nematocida minor]KAI5191421.1 alpha,alpha-trehalose phosphorylase (configuration-retaining) [Nematocida minor]